MKQVAAVFALIVFLASSTTGGFVVVFCSKPACESRSTMQCPAAAPTECRPCCPAETGCPKQERCSKPEAEPDQTRVVFMPLLAVASCDVERCSNVCSSTALGDYREQPIPARPDPGLFICTAPVDLAAESPPPADIHASRPSGVHPFLQTVMLRC